jgi:hypothetical protein
MRLRNFSKILKHFQWAYRLVIDLAPLLVLLMLLTLTLMNSEDSSLKTAFVVQIPFAIQAVNKAWVAKPEVHAEVRVTS